MSSIDYEELFNKYYQNEYDFNTVSLSKESLREIQHLVKEKRIDYSLAPIGTEIFSLIQEQNRGIRYEMVSFDSEKIDGMLYIPKVGEERGYIVLNSKKPLINQIFTTAHEYYHYIKDYKRIQAEGYVCDRSRLQDVSEKCASRFAAELLLPKEALTMEVDEYLNFSNIDSAKDMNFSQYAVLIIFLTVKYQMPLKAVIYRLVEEGYINDVDRYIRNYEFIKGVMTEALILEDQVKELYSTNNKYVIPNRSIYSDMKDSFLAGNATREDILIDAKKLNLNMDLIYDFLDENEDEDEYEEDEELFQNIRSEWGKMCL